MNTQTFLARGKDQMQRPWGRPSLVCETGSRPVGVDLGPRKLGGAFRAQSGGAVCQLGGQAASVIPGRWWGLDLHAGTCWRTGGGA